jgi:hypothetical protein
LATVGDSAPPTVADDFTRRFNRLRLRGDGGDGFARATFRYGVRGPNGLSLLSFFFMGME